MPLFGIDQIVDYLSPPLDKQLVTQLVAEFVSAEKRFIQRDWEPAELDGGQFCEILARILYHFDSGNLSPKKELDDCLKYIEDEKQPQSHSIQPRSHALHLARVLRTVYKFRSQRGAVHISPHYSPNHMDAKFVIESVRWAMNETLRIFWKGDREKVAKAIREVLQFDIPVIGVFEDVIRVQRTDITAEEEILILLHYAGDNGFSRSELGKYSKFTPPSVTRALQKLSAQNKLDVIQVSSGNYRLTDIGSRRVRNDLSDKLLTE